MDQAPEPALPHSDVPVSEPQQTPTISVIITKMTHSPSTSLFRDPTRLLSLSAFIFSVITGLYAMYQTYQNQKEATMESVNKLLDQYYAVADKITKIEVDDGRGNLLKSQSRAIAIRAVRQASHVKAMIDDGTWTALAHINDAQNNLAEAEQAWLAGIRNTTQSYFYLYALRGLAVTQFNAGRKRRC